MAYNTQKALVAEEIRGVVGTSTASTLIFTPAARFYSVIANIELTSTTGFVSVATLSIGTNSTDYNNILAASALTGIVAASNMLTFNLTALLSSVAASTGVYVKVTVGAVASTYLIKVALIGYYD